MLRKSVPLAVVAAAGVLAGKHSAAANPYGDPDNNIAGVGTIPDNGSHLYCQGSIDGVRWTVAVDLMNYLENATDMSSVEGGSCSNVTDLRWDGRDGLPLGTSGAFTCLDFNAATNRCDAGRAQVNVTSIQNLAESSMVDYNIRKTMCHEMGHSVGLAHYKGSTGPADRRTVEL